MGLQAYNLDFPGIYVENLSQRVSPSANYGPTSPMPAWRTLGYEFTTQVAISLNILRSKPLGKQLITEVSNRCRAKGFKVMILYNQSCNAGAYPAADDTAFKECTDAEYKAEMTRKGDLAFQECVVGKGGANAAVFWDPNGKIGFDGKERPVYISLAHELIHAHHFLHASCPRALSSADRFPFLADEDTALGEEECRTIGCGPYKGEPMSENAFRTLYNYPERTVYGNTVTLRNVRKTG